MSCQSRFDARYWMLGAGALGRPRGEVQALESKQSEFHLTTNPVLGSGTAHRVSFSTPSPVWDWYPCSYRWGYGDSQVSTQPTHKYLVELRFQVRAAVPHSPLADCLQLFSCSVMSDSFAMPRIVALPGSSVHGIFQARILDWVAVSFSRGSNNLGIEPRSSALAGRFFTTEPPGKPAFLCRRI